MTDMLDTSPLVDGDKLECERHAFVSSGLCHRCGRFDLSTDYWSSSACTPSSGFSDKQ